MRDNKVKLLAVQFIQEAFTTMMEDDGFIDSMYDWLRKDEGLTEEEYSALIEMASHIVNNIKA